MVRSYRENKRMRYMISDDYTLTSERNANPKPYKWKAKGADVILSKIKRTRASLDKARAPKVI
jgi:hypothetical protein